ncbi:MAG TPA: hypothetical protein VGL99_24620 [Chloroflexota bacterium]
MSDDDPNKGRRELGLTVSIGFAAGIAVALLTLALSNTDIGGPNWSLRGNGALIVLFAGGATLLTFGWLLLAHRVLAPAALGAVSVVVLELAFTFAPIALEPSNIVLPLVVATLALALLVGVGLARGRGATAGAVFTAVVLLLSLAPVGLQFLLLPLALPLVVALPSLWVHGSRWRTASSVALPVALIGGIVIAQVLASR